MHSPWGRALQLTLTAKSLLFFRHSSCEGNDKNGTGLLSDMSTEPSELRKAKYYSRKLPLSGSNAFSRDFYFIDKYAVFADGMRVLVPDIELISGTAAKFAETAEYYGRDKMKTYLTKVITNSDGAGRFVFVLGGKSTGKSKLLSVLSQEHPGRVVAVICRNGNNLTEMLRDELIRRMEKGTDRIDAARVLPPPMDVLPSDVAAASSHGRIRPAGHHICHCRGAKFDLSTRTVYQTTKGKE